MPGVRDKIIINSGGLVAGECSVSGNADGIDEQFRTAEKIAEEIEKAGLLWHADALAFLTEVEGICKAADDAQDKYVDSQIKTRKKLRDVTDRMRVWFDKQLQAAKQTP